jgi:hypothetical protein
MPSIDRDGRTRGGPIFLATTLAAMAQLNFATVIAAQSETTAGIIAAQLRRQGVSCTAPESAIQDRENSAANETVWVVRCQESTYRVRLVPRMRAQIEPVQ